MKIRFFLVLVFATIFIFVLASAVMAQEVPAPYADLKNPFPWDDTSAQEAGKEIYQQSCLGCHGVDGSNIAQTDFGAADYPSKLEARPDFYSWVLSEGRLDRGMPPFKSSLSEEERWQVLTHLYSLGAEVPSEGLPPSAQPPAQPPVEEAEGTLLLTIPEQARAGQPLTIMATLRDSQDKPIENATVKFFIAVDFFTSGLMEIGEAVTNEQGSALFEYIPRQMGETPVIARYEVDSLSPVETTTTLILTETDEPFYQPVVGLQLPAPGEEVFISPESSLGETSDAPTSAFRLPGGILSWLLLFAVTVMLIWFTYFRVMYQVFRIPLRREITDTDTRLIPLIGFAIVLGLGTILLLMIITGPYSHFHFFR
jgi:mono/diheme cytochrome c family protein